MRETFMKKKIIYLSLLMLLSLTSCVVGLPSTSTPSTPNTDIPSTPIPPDPNPVPPSTDSPTLPPNQLSSDINNILNTTLSTDSILSLVASNGATSNTRRSSVDYSSTFLNTVLTDNNNFKKSTYVENSGGKVSNVLMDARDYRVDSPTTTPTDQNWADLGWISQSFVSSDFRNESGNVYTYYGTSQRAILDSLTRMDLTDLFVNGNPTLTLTVSNNKIQSLKAESPLDASGNKYVLDINVLDTARSVSRPKPSQATDASTSLPFIFDFSTPHKVITTNNIPGENGSVTAIVNSEIVYVERKTNASGEPERSGFFATPGLGWSEFQKSATSTSYNFVSGPYESNSISKGELFGLDAGLNLGDASYFFQWDSSSRTTLVPIPYLVNAIDFIPFTLSNKEQIRDHTIRIYVGNDRVNVIDYDVVSSDGGIYKEKMVFTTANSTVPQTEMDAIRTLSSRTQFSWQHESRFNTSSTVWNELVSFLGQQQSSGIPYLYAKPLSGKWVSTRATDHIKVSIDLSNVPISEGYPPNTWVNQYVELIKSNGFLSNRTNGGITFYRKSGFDIEIGVRSGLYELEFRKVL